MKQCPKCVSDKITTERTPDGDSWCDDCGYTDVSSSFDIEPTAEDKAFETLLSKQQDGIIHPLLNPDSKHYSMIDGVEAITRMEDMFPKHELKIWAKITAMKYRLRIGNKDDVLKEAKKIETYEAYYGYLDA